MKKLLLMLSISFATVMLLAGCNSNRADLNNTNTHSSNQSSQKLTNLLSPATAKVPEDTQAANDNQLYSQFYQDGGQWHWKLTSKQAGTIDDSQVKSLKSTNQKYVFRLAMVGRNNKKYHLNFNWINGGHLAYTIRSSYHNVDASFVLADASQSTDWQTGAPQALQGTWATNYTNNPNNSNQNLPYIKRFLNITNTSTSSFVNEYDSNHRLYNSNTSTNNDNVSYQTAGQGTYVLKSYTNTNAPVVYRITLVNNNQIKVTGITSTPLTLSKSSSTPTTNSSSVTASSQSGSTTTTNGSTTQQASGSTANHLTDQQVVNMIWPQVKSLYPNINVNSTDFTYMPQMQNGLLYVDVLENHNAPAFKNRDVDPNSSPRVASFRVNANGQLEEMNATTGDWAVVGN